MPTPEHIAIIMDGNGRWAKKRFMPTAMGHEQGGKTVQRVIDLCLEKGVKWLTLYAFSTENWNRSALEVKALMSMLKKYLKERESEMMEKGARLHAIGELYMLPEDCQEQLRKTMEVTKNNDKLNVVLALSYGSRQEMVHAAKMLAQQALEGKIEPEDITTDMFADNLYTAGMPDPDLLIRTSGELRISNYLLWQISYSEIFVTETLWPDFGRDDFETALASFGKRERRFGAR
ncbi:MAG: isoprenyl transferase [Akkermansia sp.]